MLNKKDLEIKLENEIRERGCTDTKSTNKDELSTGYIINEKGSKEAKIVGTIAKELSLSISHKLINSAIKVPTIELGIIQTPNKVYYIDMKTGMPTDSPKKFISYSQYSTSEEDIKQKINYFMRQSRINKDPQKIKHIVTAIATRAYLYKNNICRWLEVDIDLYNNLIDEIIKKLEIDDSILIKIKDEWDLEEIKIGLEMLEPTSIYYAEIIEDLIRNELVKEGIVITTQNMRNTIALFIKALNINDNCIELGSGAAGILREQYSDNNIVRGVEINKYISDLSKVLNLISGKDNIEIKQGDALNIEEVEKYGLTIAEPPLGARVNSEQYKSEYRVARNSKMVNTSDLFLEKAINITKDGGYIVAVVNDGLLFTTQSTAIRKLILDNTIIKGIVSLPDHVQKPYSVVKMSIIIMKKKTTNLENCENIFINEINKLDEINEVSEQFAKFIQNDSNENNTESYSVLYESDNWTVNYLRMFNELNSSNRYALNELCEINSNGIRSLINEKEKYPYIEVSNIDTDKKILKDVNEVSYNELPSRAKLLAYPGDIVISTARPDKGAIAIIPNDNDVYIVSTALAVLSPKNISAELLYFILGSEKVTQELASLASGTAVPMILMKQLKEYKLPMSDIPKQYEKEAKELYEKMMVKYTQHKTLNQIIDEELKKVDDINIKEYKIENIMEYKRPVVLNGDKEVKQVKIVNLNSESLYVNEEELDVFDEKQGRHNLINNKDILIPRILDSIYRTSVADSNIEGCISNQFIYTYSTIDIALPEYIAMMFRSSKAKEKLQDLATGTKGRTMLKRDGIQSITIKLPTLEIQQYIVEQVLTKSKEYGLHEINIEKSSFEAKLV
ncbi:MAG: N-6 DNA methylase [Terrisporobacter sp.]